VQRGERRGLRPFLLLNSLEGVSFSNGRWKEDRISAGKEGYNSHLLPPERKNNKAPSTSLHLHSNSANKVTQGLGNLEKKKKKGGRGRPPGRGKEEHSSPASSFPFFSGDLVDGAGDGKKPKDGMSSFPVWKKRMLARFLRRKERD